MKKCSFVVLFVLTAVTTSAAGPDTKYKAPRNELGQPDLQGVWNFSSDVPLERPAAVADKKLFTREELAKQKAAKASALAVAATVIPVEAVSLTWLDYAGQIENLRTSLIAYPENGRLPKVVEGVRRLPGVDDFIAALNDAKGTLPPALLSSFGGGRKDGPEDLSVGERCLTGSDSPLVPAFDNNYLQIFQAKDHVVLLTESFHHARIVPLDNRPVLSEKLRSWSGDSRGRWEGDTLVVVTTNYNRRTGFAGARTSDDKVITERFTRVSNSALEYEATIVDPKTFQDKVVLSFPMAKSESRIYEVACHEGNYSMMNTLAAARKEEQDRVSPETESLNRSISNRLPGDLKK
jgi:hypothetical protein